MLLTIMYMIGTVLVASVSMWYMLTHPDNSLSTRHTVSKFFVCGILAFLVGCAWPLLVLLIIVLLIDTAVPVKTVATNGTDTTV